MIQTKEIYYHVKYKVRITEPGEREQIKRMYPDLLMESNISVIARNTDKPDEVYAFILSACTDKIKGHQKLNKEPFRMSDLYDVHVSIIASFDSSSD